MADINLGVGGANSAVAGGYDIANSLKFEPDNTEYLERATGGGNGDTRKHTISVWVKRTELSNGTNTYIMGFSGGRLRFETNDIIEYQFRSGRKLETTARYRDTSAWYHIVVVADSTLATSTDRMKLWVNGVRVTDFTTYIPQDQNQGSPLWGVYNNYNFRVGGGGSYTSDGINGYLSEVYYINGQTLDPTDFGEFDEDTGIWKPKDISGLNYGTGNNSFFLDFETAADLGANAKGNDVNFTLNNITSADQATDTPTNNFATFNPLLPNSSEKEGATVFINPDAGADTNLSTIAVANGKWYAEFKASSNISGDNGMVGVAANSGDSIAGRFLGQDAWSVGLLTNGSYYINSSATSYLGTTFNQDIISVALDMDNKKVYFAKNGTWGNSGNPATGTNGIALPSAYEDYEWFIGTSLVLSTATYDGNYGGYTVISIASGNTDANGYGTFEYAPPSGYYALCTKNLAEYG